MADSKITALTALTAADPANDMMPIVDVSDTSMAASGTTKRISINNILACSPSATLASATITGDLTVDTSTLKVDSANNRVGIGTASPAYLLDIQDASLATRFVATNTNNSAFGSGLYLRTLNSGSLVSNATLATANDGTLNLYTGTTTESVKMSIGPTGIFTWQNVGGVAGTAMTLNSTGLGVGVTPSAWFASSYKALQVNTTGVLASFGSGSNQSTRLANNWFSNTSGVDTYITSNFATVYQQNSGQHQWYTAASGTAGNAITFTQAMTLDASGRLILLASTTTPATLSTNGQLTMTATSDTNLRFSYRGSDGVTRVANLTLA